MGRQGRAGKGQPRSRVHPPKGVLGHRIPAPLPAELTERIQADAKRAFAACTCDGLVRVDFLVKGDEVIVNEINTIPGSLAFYLWEASGVPFPELLDRLLSSALEHAEARSSLTFSLDRNLLAEIEARQGRQARLAAATPEPAPPRRSGRRTPRS